MATAHVDPLFIRLAPSNVSLVAKVTIQAKGERTLTYIRYFPDNFSYDDIREDVHNSFDVSDVMIQTVWFLPTYDKKDELPF